jgi:hypothetical protein
MTLLDSAADRLTWSMQLNLCRRILLRLETALSVAMASGPTATQAQALADADMWLGQAVNALTAAENEVRKL